MEAEQTGMSTNINFSADVVEVLSRREKATGEPLLGRVGFFSIVKYKESWELAINPKNGTLYNVNISMYFKAVH